MKAALENFKKAIYSPCEAARISSAELRQFADNCVVALAVGGEGSRLKAITESQQVHKTALRLPDGETMAERTIRMYRDAGFRDFVALVFHHAQSVIDTLGDGGRLGVHITYSHDPERPVGRGGAIRNALDNGSIPRTKNLIVHNPDDQIIRYEGSFPHDIAAGHLAGVQRGMLATAVVVDGTPYTYTGMKIDQGVVEQIEMYPFIPIPTHVGVTVFSPGIYSYFTKLFDLTRKVDFESVLFPLLAEEKRLYSFMIPGRCWLSVNDPKALAKLTELVQMGNSGD
ncbi:MAG TPA: sugar phosphate nucleotidyltransferase [Ktedonobacteraceae bacterium]|nr:sugar phosphate nucleotidyltransferase [Ktedonobacteraceae bacterium]